MTKSEITYTRLHSSGDDTPTHKTVLFRAPYHVVRRHLDAFGEPTPSPAAVEKAIEGDCRSLVEEYHHRCYNPAMTIKPKRRVTLHMAAVYRITPYAVSVTVPLPQLDALRQLWESRVSEAVWSAAKEIEVEVWEY